MELAGFEIVILIFVALLAGAINTVAGGGSNLVLPTLMIMGMPPEVANATNRVGIFVESVVAVSEFKRHKKLETFDLKAILIPMAIGGLFGSLAAAFAPSCYSEAAFDWNDDLYVSLGPFQTGGCLATKRNSSTSSE